MITIVGASGNTGSVLARHLLQAGRPVRVLSREVGRVKSLTDQGAQVALADLEDVASLTEAFRGSEAVYAMIPPNWALQESWGAYQDRIIANTVDALKGSGVRRVVLLSSQGSHRPDAGPVSGLGRFERALEAQGDLHLVILRPGYFMQNLYNFMGMISGMGILGSGLRADLPIPMVHTNDIADRAAEYLVNPTFEGVQRVVIPGAADITMTEMAAILGQAIGRPDLPYIQSPYEQNEQGMTGFGIPETIAKGYSELERCFNEGHYLNDYQRVPDMNRGITLEQFAQNEFAPAYLAMETAQKEAKEGAPAQA